MSKTTVTYASATWLLGGLLAASGCDRNATPVPAPAPTTSAPAMTPEAATAAIAPKDPTVAEFLGLTAPKPESWAWQPSASSMRAANYLVARGVDGEDTQVVVFFFGANMGGGVNENISRWASQFQSATGGPVAPIVEQDEVDGMAVTHVEINGSYRGMNETYKPDHTFLAAIVEAPVGRLFIRLVGPTDVVEANREAFKAMVDGLRKAEAP